MKTPRDAAATVVEMPAPRYGAAMNLGLLATAAGTAAWAALILFAHREMGILAWGIGFLVGLGIVRGGGHGLPLAITAALLTVLSIGGGKYCAYWFTLDKAVAENLTWATEDNYQSAVEDARLWRELGDAPTDEQVKAFLQDRNYDEAAEQEFRSEQVPQLQWLTTSQASFEQWQRHQHTLAMERVSAAFPFTMHLREDFHGLDLLFLALGISTAFSLVNRHTAALQAAVRQAQREAKRAAASESATAIEGEATAGDAEDGHAEDGHAEDGHAEDGARRERP